MGHVEKDDMIGKVFGTNNCLTVLQWTGEKIQNQKVYSCFCHVCFKDRELFGDAIFFATKFKINKGYMPCACKGSFRWSREQYAVRLKRKCDALNISFIGFAGDYAGIDSLVNLKCKKDGYEWITTADNALQGKMCKECLRSIQRNTYQISEDDYIKRFISTGKFKDGSVFKKVGKYDWSYICPICSFDEFSSAGVCDGIFIADVRVLCQGGLVCRCSNKYSWDQKQQEYRIKNIIKKFPSIDFCGWHSGYVNVNSIAIFNCQKHGKWNVSANTFINSGTRCPSCAKTGFKTSKDSYIYVLLASDGFLEFSGYGITNNVLQRIPAHKGNLKKKGFEIRKYTVFKTSGISAKRIEALIMNTYPLFKQDVVGFRRESTNSWFYDSIVALIKKEI